MKMNKTKVISKYVEETLQEVYSKEHLSTEEYGGPYFRPKLKNKDKNTGKEQSIVIKASSGLSDDDIEKMVKDAEANAEDDKKFEELVKTKNNADMLVHATRKTIEESGDKLSDDKKKPIESALEDLKKAYESKDLEKIDETLNAINEAWKNASEEMYKAQAESGAGQPGEGRPASDNQNTNTDSKGDDVQDVDFEEVKEE